jgi:hypothetical protein
MTIDIEKLIEMSLSGARSVIEEGGTWSPLLHIVPSEGVWSVFLRGMIADPCRKNLVEILIKSRMKELNGIVAIMISDTWVGDATPADSLRPSLQDPFPGRAEALAVEMWWRDGVAECGLQMYRRCADGKVVFEELQWQEPSTEFRFAGRNIEQKANVLGVPAGSKKGYIN